MKAAQLIKLSRVAASWLLSFCRPRLRKVGWPRRRKFERAAQIPELLDKDRCLSGCWSRIVVRPYASLAAGQDPRLHQLARPLPFFWSD